MDSSQEPLVTAFSLLGCPRCQNVFLVPQALGKQGLSEMLAGDQHPSPDWTPLFAQSDPCGCLGTNPYSSYPWDGHILLWASAGLGSGHCRDPVWGQGSWGAVGESQ